MHRVTRSVLLPVLFAPLVVAQEDTAEKPEPTFELSAAEIAAGWHVLFDGTSTDAWRGYRQQGFPAQGWTVDDGALHHGARGGGGDIITRRRYRNFELVFEWRVAEGANSGVMYRVAETDEPSYHTGPEYQILDDSAHPGANPVNQAGALYGLYPAGEVTARGPGDWNTARIRIVGDRVEHFLNGEQVVDATFGSEEYRERLAKSKFADWDGFGEHRRGHLCLQDHGDAVWYRNMKVRELPPEPRRLGERVVLFGGSGLDRWKAFLADEDATMSDVWSVQDGVLVCKGEPRGYIYTDDTFEDFVLSLDWRFDPEQGAGNSGVLLRTNGEHRVWPRSIEAQLWSGNAGDFWNIGDMQMSVDPARTDGRNTKKTHGNEKPVGQWNHYEIICDDGWIQLRVNGEVLNEAWDCAERAGWICLQSEGAVIHFRDVVLRELKPVK